MKKVFGQTVRDLKREVNKTVLKVPRLEQKVLDATSNEPWGPHGTLLADIAQATRNFNEYQMIMTVLWKRINDSGKNWRHVYKALTVLDYLVANGSERVIDEIMEHAYQISTLFDFQYIDSRGRDQGINVRKKAQSLVNLVNDKERIIEVRQQAAANREKFRNTASTGGMGRPGGYGDRYDDNRHEERYGSRDQDKNGVGYGSEREYEYRDEDRYDRNRDSYSRDGDRNGRDYDEGQGRDYDNCRRSRSVDDFQRGSTDVSVDRDRDHASDDDGQYSSRSSGVRVDDRSQDGKRLDKKLTEQDIGAPPNYEEALSESRSPANGERDGDTSATPAPRTSGAPFTNSQSPSQSGTSATVLKNGVEVFDEFDPRSSVSAALSTSKIADMDLLGSLTESFSNPLAIMSAAPVIPTTAFEPGASPNSGAAPSFSTSGSDFANEMYANPFGDSPFKAVPSDEGTNAQQYGSASTEALHSSRKQSPEPHHGGMLGADTVSNFGFGETFSIVTYPAHTLSIVQSPPLNSRDSVSSNQDVDILADILPPSQTAHSFSGYSAPPTFPNVVGYPPQMDSITYGHLPVNTDNFQTQSGPVGKFSSGMPLPQGGLGMAVNPQVAPPMPAIPNSQLNSGSFYNQQGGSQPSSGPVPPSNGNPNQHSFPTGAAGNLLPQAEASTDHLQTQSGLVGQFSNGMLLPNGRSGIAVNPQMAPPMPAMPNSQLNSGNFYNQQGGPRPSSGPVPPSSGNLNQHSFPTGAAGNLLPQAEANTDNLQGQSGLDGQFSNGMLLPQGGSGIAVNPQVAPPMPAMPNSQLNSGSFYNQLGGYQPSSAPAPLNSGNFNQHNFPTGATGNLLPQVEANTSLVSHHSLPPSTASLSAVSNPSKDKFETKSTVWADTLSRGLVNLNISGPKTNPLADIGIDFDYLNRKDKRMEKPSQAPVASTITMGKAMGSGSGMGRTGAGALRPPSNPMMGSHMGMGPPGSAGGGMVMGGYGGMNQPGMGMGMNMNLGMSNMGSAMNIGMGQQPMGIPQGTNMSPMAIPGGYNPMMNNPQQPYGGAYSMMNTPQQSYGGGYQ